MTTKQKNLHFKMCAIALTILLSVAVLSKCKSHSPLLEDAKTPRLCKYSIECSYYFEKQPTACTTEKDLCSWVERETFCTEKSQKDEFLEKGKFSRREIYLDCLSRQK